MESIRQEAPVEVMKTWLTSRTSMYSKVEQVTVLLFRDMVSGGGCELASVTH